VPFVLDDDHEPVGRRRTRVGLAALLAGAGTLHFVTPTFFDELVPGWVPGDPRAWTYASGVAELGVAGMLAHPCTRRLGGWAAFGLLMAVYPANIWDVVEHPPTDARGVASVVRLPLQLPLLAGALRVAGVSRPGRTVRLMTEDHQSPRGDVFIATSLDGYIARPDGTLDWLTGRPAEEETGEHDPDQDFGYGAFLATVDALFMGRATFDVVQGFDGDWPYPKPVYVWTSDPAGIEPKAGADVRPVAGTLDEALEGLRADGIGRVYVDGGSTIRAWLRAGLVDRMTISTVPVLIGDGIPLFGGTGDDIRLELERAEAFPGGMVQRTYVVVP